MSQKRKSTEETAISSAPLITSIPAKEKKMNSTNSITGSASSATNVENIVWIIWIAHSISRWLIPDVINDSERRP